MPTIEIVSINADRLGLRQADFSFAIIEENKLISHRGLFYEFLSKHSGVIVHIGNPEFRGDKDHGYYAGEIVDWSFGPDEIVIPVYRDGDGESTPGSTENPQLTFRFLQQYRSDIDKLLNIALANSPIEKVYFLTDYQFGPEKGSIEIHWTVTEFWAEHDNEGLCLNTLYEIYGR